MTDYSPVPELNLLKEFEDGCDVAFAAWAWMDDFGEMEFPAGPPELRRGLLRFASAGLGGSLYALWRRDDRADLASLPVVLLGDEGGMHIVARDVREFLRLLGSLDGEIDCDWSAVFEESGEELPGRPEYLAWLDRNFGLAPPDDPWALIKAAQADLADEWDAWMRPFVPDAAQDGAEDGDGDG